MTGKIAFVDDEVSMHEMVKVILETPGETRTIDLFAEPENPPNHDEIPYRIDYFTDPVTACENIRKAHGEGDPFALLITDIRMPQRDGSWLVGKAREADPNIRVIIFTSYMDFTIEELADSAKSRNFIYLEKTVSPVVFKQAVDAELEAWMELVHNRRLLKRIRFQNKVRFKVPTALSGTAVDVTPTGIGVVEIRSPIEIDSAVELEIVAGRVTTRGKVRWIDREGDHYRVGIQFDEEDLELFELVQKSPGHHQ